MVNDYHGLLDDDHGDGTLYIAILNDLRNVEFSYLKNLLDTLACIL